MIKAIYKKGIIQPVEPVPPNWTEGQELAVNLLDGDSMDSLDAIDRWYHEAEAAVAQLNDPEEHLRIRDALALADRQAKEWVRREMELP
jgi:hypothetical protein